MSHWLTNWPFWLGSVAFAAIVLGYWKLLGHPMGASGSYARVADAASDREQAKRELALSDEAALEAALRAATEAEFGPDALPPASGRGGFGGAAPASDGAALLPWSAHLVFLAMMVVGGFLATFLRGGGWKLTFDLGAAHARFFGHGVAAGLLLLVAGAFIGFGTRMAGGCSSGHGLSGCARLQPGSLVGTAAFFGAAVGISLLLERLLG